MSWKLELEGGAGTQTHVLQSGLWAPQAESSLLPQTSSPQVPFESAAGKQQKLVGFFIFNHFKLKVPGIVQLALSHPTVRIPVNM